MLANAYQIVHMKKNRDQSDGIHNSNWIENWCKANTEKRHWSLKDSIVEVNHIEWFIAIHSEDDRQRSSKSSRDSTTGILKEERDEIPRWALIHLKWHDSGDTRLLFGNVY